MAKTLKAKTITVPDRVWKQLDEAQVGKTNAHLEDILTDMGALQEKQSWGIAVGLMHTFKGLVEAYPETAGHKFGLKGFSDILFGLTMSYTLGMGRWYDDWPIFMPDMLNASELLGYDQVKLRSGKVMTMEDFMSRITRITCEKAVSGVFDKVTDKNVFGRYKEISPKHRVDVLLAMIKVADEI